MILSHTAISHTMGKVLGEAQNTQDFLAVHCGNHRGPHIVASFTVGGCPICWPNVRDSWRRRHLRSAGFYNLNRIWSTLRSSSCLGPIGGHMEGNKVNERYS